MQVNRSYVTAGDWVLIWFPAPMLDTVKLGQTPLERVWTYRRPAQYESWFWQMVRVPKNTTPGEYKLTAGSDYASLTVKGETKRTVISASDISTANQYLARGYNVTLTPGEYRVTTPLSIPQGQEVRGYGAVLTGSTSAYQNALIRLSSDTSITGVSFRPENAAFYADKPPVNVTVDDCNFNSGHFGIMATPGLVVKRCRFNRSGIVNLNSGAIVDCDFTGLSDVEHSLSTVGNAKVACVQLSFDRTDRGPILRGASDSLFAGIKCRDVYDINNGGEICCIEGSYPVNRNLFFGWRTSNCLGHFQPFDCEFNDNLCQDFQFDGGGIALFGLAEQSNNTFADIRLSRSGVFLNTPGFFGAKDNKFRDVGILDWRVQPGNLATGAKFYYERPDLTGYSPFCDLSGRNNNNTVTGLTVKGTPVGRVDTSGVIVGN